MQNRFFTITFDEKSGGIVSIANPFDSNNMNWCSANSIWGLIRSGNGNFSWKSEKKR